jgi:predicted AAA+ superfamily ATPase
VHRFDLETTAGLAALRTPELALRPLEGTVVIDEVQRLPELFSVLRPLADREPAPAKFLLLGSASPELIRGISESLAGRVQFVPVPGFALREIGGGDPTTLWLRGGFPRSYLAESEAASMRWRSDFIRTFLERDIPQLGFRVPSETMNRFWTMLAHYHGQHWNGSELARSLGVTEKTARHYLDILAGAYVARVLLPWFENTGKRQRKAPKVYVRDSGLVHALLGIESIGDLRSHPKYGASWEGFALEQVLIRFGDRNAYYWGTQRGAELDLMITRHGKRFGFEFKCSDAPNMTRSLHVAIADLGLSQAYVIYPGDRRFHLHENVEALPLSAIDSLGSAIA